MTDLMDSVLKKVKGDEVQSTCGEKRPHDVREEGTEGADGGMFVSLGRERGSSCLMASTFLLLRSKAASSE